MSLLHAAFAACMLGSDDDVLHHLIVQEVLSPIVLFNSFFGIN